MTGRVVHFEVPFDDGDRARDFYKEVFDWQIQPMPEMNYTIVSTGPTGDQGMPSEPGFIGGGMMQRQAPVNSPVITIAVDVDTLRVPALVIEHEAVGAAAELVGQRQPSRDRHHRLWPRPSRPGVEVTGGGACGWWS